MLSLRAWENDRRRRVGGMLKLWGRAISTGCHEWRRVFLPRLSSWTRFWKGRVNDVHGVRAWVFSNTARGGLVRALSRGAMGKRDRGIRHGIVVHNMR